MSSSPTTTVAADPKRKGDDVSSSAAGAKKGKFVPKGAADAAGEEKTVAIRWNSTSVPIDEFITWWRANKDSISHVPDGKSKYWQVTEVSADGKTTQIRGFRVAFLNRLMPMGITYFAANAASSLPEGAGVNVILTDDEYNWFVNEWQPWVRKTVLSHLTDFYSEKEIKTSFEEGDDAGNEKHLKKTYQSNYQEKRPNPKKPDEFFAASLKTKVRTSPDTQLPNLNVFDATEPDEHGNPKIVYYHPDREPLQFLGNGKKNPDYESQLAMYKANIAAHKEKYKNGLEDACAKIVPKFCFADIDCDLLGLCIVQGKLNEMTGIREICIVKKSENKYNGHVYGAAPVSRFAKRSQLPAAEPVGKEDIENAGFVAGDPTASTE